MTIVIDRVIVIEWIYVGVIGVILCTLLAVAAWAAWRLALRKRRGS